MPVCPFCGVATEALHESQQGCLTALTAEITRMRAVLDHVHSTKVPVPAEDEGQPDDPATGD